MRSSEFWGWDFFLEKGYVETEKQLNEDKVGRNKYNDKLFARAMLKFQKKKKKLRWQLLEAFKAFAIK